MDAPPVPPLDDDLLDCLGLGHGAHETLLCDIFRYTPPSNDILDVVLAFENHQKAQEMLCAQQQDAHVALYNMFGWFVCSNIKEIGRAHV